MPSYRAGARSLRRSFRAARAERPRRAERRPRHDFTAGRLRRLLAVPAAAVIAVSGVVVTAVPAEAAPPPGRTFVVDIVGDVVDARPGDGLCATSTGDCSLRAAVQESNSSAGADTIELGSGVHELELSGPNEDAPEVGDHDIQDSVTIVGAGATESIVDGGEPASNGSPGSPGMDRLFEVHPTATTVTFRDLTLREGYSTDDGGAVLNWSSGLVRFEQVTLARNLADGAGGAIANSHPGEYPWPVADPSQDTLPGGRIEIQGSTLRNNGATGGGAAVYNESKGTVTFVDSRVSDNPGEMRVDPQDPTRMIPAPGVFEPASSAITNAGEFDGVGTIRLTDSFVVRNWSPTSGAGIENRGFGTLTLERTLVEENTSLASGGGVYTKGGTVTVKDASVIRANKAAQGGGLATDGASNAAGLRSKVVISNSKVNGNTAEASGGGIESGGLGQLTLTDTEVRDNKAGDAGGGLHHGGRAGLEVVRATFAANQTHDEGGGAFIATERLAVIKASTFTANLAGTPEPTAPGQSPVDPSSVNIAGGGGVYTENGAVEITGSTFTANRATDNGGAVSIDNHGDVLFADSVIKDNRAGTDGGGIENSGTRVTFDGLMVDQNRAELDGGGIYNSSSGEFEIRDTTVRLNSGVSGGGLANAPDNKIRIVNSLFHRNTARTPPRGDAGEFEEGGHGGGIWSMADGDSHIENTTISGNVAATGGGGLFHDADGKIKLSNVTVWRNSAPMGGAIGVVESDFVPEVPPKPNVAVILRNTIVGGSVAGGSCDYYVTSEGGNVDTGSSCFISVIDGDSGPTDIRDRRGDPQLDAIADNGGPTLSHMPRYGSLAIDAGVSPCPETDQRGTSRPQNGRCDSGSVEFVGDPPAGDDEAPDTEYLSGPIQDSLETVAFEFTGTDNQTATNELQYECRLVELELTEPPEPTAPWEPVPTELRWHQCSSPWSVPLVEEGLYDFEVRAIDRAGKVDPSPAVHHFDGTDQNPPDTRIVEAPANPTSARTATFTFTGLDNITPPQFMEYECRLDSRDPDLWLECFNPAIYSNLTSGEHTLEVRAYDGNENVDPTPARYTWTVGLDSSGPVNCDTANIALTPTADAWVDQVNPSENYLFETELTVRSDATGDPGASPPQPIVGQNARALLRFGVPTDAPDCTLESAALKLYAGSHTEGRTLSARPLSGSFKESTVTWASQPGVEGAAAAQAASGAGYRSFDVTAHVQAMMDGDLANHGWSIRDSQESEPGGGDQSFASRELPQDPPEQTIPVLELTYAADAAPAPEPPTLDPNTPPTPVHCGMVVTRSLVAGNDLSCALGEGLVIGAPNIILDLGGHTIDGPNYLLDNVSGQEEGFPAAIRNSGHTNVTIRNGTVQEMGYGVLLTSGTTRNVVHGLTVRRHAMAGIELFDADDGRNGNVVHSNTIEDNELGVSLVAGAQNSVVRDNVIGGNLGEQILVQFSHGNLLEGNQVHGIPSDPALDSDGGILLDGANQNTIRGGEVRDTGDAGVGIHRGSNGNQVLDTVFYRNGDAGVVIGDSDGTRVSGIVAHQESDAGVVVNNGHDTQVRESDLRHNPSGVEASGTNDLVVEGNDASHSLASGFSIGNGVNIRLVDNEASHTGGSGIALEGGILDANGDPVGGGRVEGNTTNQNAEHGITVADGGHRVLDNDAHNNAGFGVALGEWPEVLGGLWPHSNLAPPDIAGALNRASGNGEVTQCSGLVCDETGNVPVLGGDDQPPVTVLTSGPTDLSPAPTGATASTSATFEFTATDNRTAPTAMRYECRIDAPDDPPAEPEEPPTEPPEPGSPPDVPEPPEGLNWHECVSPVTYHDLEQGAHHFEVRAVDQAGLFDLTPARHEWNVDISVSEEGTGPDTVAPDTRIASGPTGETTSTTATFAFAGTDNSTPGANLSFECRLDGAAWSPCQSPASFAGLAVGQHTFEVRATDRATSRNTDPTPASRTWTVLAEPTDTTPPDTTLTSTSDHVTTARQATFGFTSDDPTATFECKLDAGPWAECTSPHNTVADLATGQHDFLVRARDGAGNVDPTPAARTWIVGSTPTPGFVYCGQVITASTVVRNDLIDCLWDGLRIGANNITIDLDGHTIDGKGIAAAIRNDGFDNVTIKNGKLVDFDHGVMLNPGTVGNIIENLDIENNQESGVSLGVVPHPTDPSLPTPDPAPPSFQSNVLDNVVRDNDFNANARGIWLTNKTANTTVRHNNVHGSSGEGIWVERANNNLIELNQVTATSGHAVSLQGSNGNRILENNLSENSGGVLLGVTTTGTVGLPSNDNRVEKNTILESSESGIEIDQSDRNTVLQNVAKFASGDGVDMYGADENLVKDNDLRANKGGLSLIGSNGNRLEGNDTSDSGGSGISLEALSLSNTLVNNTSSGNDGDGMYIGDESSASTGMWIEGNRTSNNKGYGIYVSKVSHTLKANIADDNGGWGIWVSDGSNGRTNTDAGGNKAQGNMGPLDPITLRPLQCFSVRCDGGTTTSGDQIAPDTQFLTTPEDPSSAAVQTFRFTGSDNLGAVTFQCSLGALEWGPCASPLEYTRQQLTTLTGHGLGEHTLRVRAVDQAGNVDLAPASYTWEVGPVVIPPASVSIQSAPDARTVATVARFEFSTNGSGTIGCSLDGGPFAPCESPKEYTGLAVGEHTFTVRFTNSAGEESTATHTWRISATAVADTVSCGEVVTRSIRVTNDLVNCPGNGLIVGTGGITIDLDGHTVDGVGLDSGILNNGYDDVTITNGAVHEFDYGVTLNPGSGNNIVERMQFELNQEAGVGLSGADQDGAGSTVRNNTLVGNGIGIAVHAGTRDAEIHGNSLGANTAEGVLVENGVSVNVTSNEIATSGGAGIALVGGNLHVLRNNELTDNGAGILVGEELLGSQNAQVEDNSVRGGGSGIVVTDSTGVGVLRNVVRATTGAGVELALSDNAVVRGNDLRSNQSGITIEESSDVRIEGNNASDALGTGIEVGTLAHDNLIIANTASSNGGEGIEVADSAPSGQANVLEGNTADGNGGDGISIAAVGHVVEDNSASSNGGWGIYAAVGVTDRGGNYAAGNAEPAQCYNVVCTIGTVAGAPETWIVDAPPLISNSRNASFTYNGSDNTLATHELIFECRIDSTDPLAWEDCEYPAEFLNLSPGEHTVDIRAVEPSGLADPTPATHTWTYTALPANDPPESVIDVKPPAETWLPDAVFTFHADEPDVTFECKVDLHPYEPCGFDTASSMSQGAFEWALEPTEVGPHTFSVRAIDFEGNVGEAATYTWRLMGVVTTFTSGPGFVPAVPPEDPATGGPTTSRSATIGFIANVADATYECSLDLEPFTACTSPVTYSDLAPGDHQLRVVATRADGVSELEAAAYEWEVLDTGDAIPPETSIERAPANLSSATTFEFVGTDNATPSDQLVFQCRLDSTSELDWQECTSPFNLLDTWTYADPQMAAGTHTFEVRAVDPAEPLVPDPNNPEAEGNPDPTPATYTWTSVLDTTPPGTGINSGVPDRIGQATEASVTFFGTDNATPTSALTFECSVDGAAFEQCTSPETVTGLEPGAHELRIRSVDLAGNRDLTPAVDNFTVVSTPVTTITSGPAGRVVDGNQSQPLSASENAVFVFGSNQPGSTFECSLDGADFTACTSPRAYWVVTNGTHELEVRATNPEGVVEETPASYTWTVELGPDVTNPNTTIVSGPPGVDVNQVASFTFAGTDNRTPVANLTFECALDGTAYNSCTSPQQFSDLTRGTHVLLVRASDAAGNFDGSPARYEWVVESPPLTTISSGPDQVTSSASATFAFAADVPGSTFQCWMDGTMSACTSPVTYEGLAPGPHLFAVLATTPGGTTEQQWAEYEWVTGETAAPVTEITAKPALTHERSEPVEFAFTTSSTGATFECSLDGADFAPCTSPRTWSRLALGEHTFSVQAVYPIVNGPDGTPLERLYEPVPTSYTFTVVDTAPPDTTVTYGPAESTTSPNAWFGLSTSEPGAEIQCSLDGAAFSACETPHQIEALETGEHTLRARAVDLGGLTDPTPATHTWTVTAGAANTPVGSDVRVQLPMPGGGTASATFFEVSTAGSTGLGGLNGGPSLPAGYGGGRFVDFHTTAGYGDPVRLCLPYNPADLAGSARILAHDGTSWVDITLTNNPVTGVVCAEPEAPGLMALAAGTGVFPLASITDGPPNPSSSGTATFSFVVDQPDALALCSIDEQPYEACTSPKTYTQLEAGDHTFSVKALGSGSVPTLVPPVYEWEIVLGPDATAPDTTITSGPGEVTGSFINTFEFTGTDDQTPAVDLEFECLVDGALVGGCQSPEEVEVLTAGEHVVEVRAVDAAGNVDPTPARWTYTVVDVSAPDTAIDSGPASETNETTATFEFSGEEPNGTAVTRFECSLDLGAFEPCPTPYTVENLAPGPHALWVRAKDDAGIVDPTPDVHEWLITGPADTEAPDTTIAAGPGELSGPDTVFGFQSNELVPGYECRLDGGAWTSCEAGHELVGLDSGEHTLEVRAVDAAEPPNVDPTPASRTWTVVGEPETTITSHPAPLSAGHTATFEFESDQPGASFRCSVDGSAFTPCTSPFLAGPLAQDAHTFEVVAMNGWTYLDGERVMDQTPAEFEWQIQDVAPPETTISSVVALGPEDLENPDSLRFEITGTDNGTVWFDLTFECSLDGGPWSGCETPYHYVDLVDLTGGQHTLRVRATDDFENVDPTPAEHTFTVEAEPETSILEGPVAESDSTTATFDFDTNGSAGTTYQCALDGAPFAACSDPVTFTDLPFGEHELLVRAVGSGGAVDGSPAEYTWVTGDMTPPVVTITTGPDAETTSTTAAFGFAADDPDATFLCSLDGAPLVACTTPASYTDLEPGLHTLEVSATKAHLLVEAVPAVWEWTVLDVTAPQVTLTSTPAAEIALGTAAEFAFSTTETGATFECSLDGAAFAACDSPVEYADLQPGEHTFSVRSVDGAGNASEPTAAYSFTVVGPATTTIDSAPAAATTDRSATFTFSANQSGVTFACSLDGAAFETCTSPVTHADLGLGGHTFSVRTTNRVGLVEDPVVSSDWTVEQAGPGPAPVTTISSGPAGSTSSDSATFEFTADQAGATFQCKLDAADYAPCSSPAEFTGLAEGEHTLQVRAASTDGAVEDPPATRTWTVDLAPETVIESGPPASTLATSATFELRSNDPAASFECALDGDIATGSFGSCARQPVFNGLAEGEHNLAVRAVDVDGNADASPATYTWTVEGAVETTVTPEFDTTTTPSGDVITESRTASFALSSNKAGATFECAFGEAADVPTFSSCDATVSYADLPYGEHVLLVRAVHGTGAGAERDLTPEEFEWSVGTTPAEVTLSDAPAASTDSRSATFAFAAPGAPGYECRLDDAPWSGCTSPQEFTGLTYAAHTFSVRVLDPNALLDAPIATHEWTVGKSTLPETSFDATLPETTGVGTDTRPVSFPFSSNEANATFECSLDEAPFAACESPAALTGLSIGQHTFAVRAVDDAGQADPTPATHTWTVADQPVTSIVSGPDVDVPGGAEASFSFGSDVAGSTFECSLDAEGAWVACPATYALADLTDGEHTLRVRATSPAGIVDATPETWTWSVALVPDTTIVSGPAGRSTEATASFRFSATEADVTYYCSLDTGPFEECTGTSDVVHHQVTVAAGDHTLKVVAEDSDTNRDATPATYEWTVLPVPETTLASAPDAESSSTAASFGFTSAAGNTFQCRVDGGEWAACSSPSELTDLALGNHSFAVRAVDADNNVDPTPATHQWRVVEPRDTEPPSTTLETTPPALTASTDAHFEIASSELGSTFECRLDNASFTTCTALVDHTGLALGEHTFEARATDVAGNVDPTPVTFSWTVVPAPETTIGSGPQSGEQRQATFTFSADVADSTFECSLDGGEWAGCATPKEFTGLAVGEHTFRVRATSPAGLTDGTPAVHTWTVGETTVPATSIGEAPAAETTSPAAAFTFSADESGTTFECRLDDGAWASCTSPKEYAGLALGEHTFAVRATDGDGNTDASPATHTWTVRSAADTEAPDTQVGSGPEDPTTATSASVAFTGTDNVSQPGALTFECRRDLTGAWTACVSPATWTGVTPGLHTLEVRAVDEAGNIDASPAFHQWFVRSTATPNCSTAQTLFANADAWLDQGSTGSNKGTDSSLKVQSKSGNINYRAVVKFAAPTVPNGCVVDTATLRMWNDSPKNGRTLQALRLNAAWTEGAVTWANQPATAGTAATVPSGSTKGWREWAVAGQVNDMLLLGAHHGFLVRDAVENQGSTEQQFFSREKGGSNRPQLVVRFKAAPPDTAAPDTSITGGPSGTTAETTATFAYTTTEPGGTFECSLDNGPFVLCTFGAQYTGLASGAHTFVVRARDLAGNRDPLPGRRDWTIE